MKIKLIETGEIAEVENTWGERLIEHGKAIPLKAPEKAEVTVADKLPEAEAEEPAEAEEKPETAKKAGKKR